MNYDTCKNAYRISMPKIQYNSNNNKRSAVFKVDRLVKANVRGLNNSVYKQPPREKLESFLRSYGKSNKGSAS